MKNIVTIILSVLLLISCGNKTPQKGIELVTVEQFNKEYSANDDQLLDVRTAEEFNEEKIKDAIHIDVLNENLFKQKIQTLDKDKTTYVYCRSGRRSADASKILKENGFKNIKDIKGGILAWKEK